jgi:lipoprotein-anchoring transpeptidase ErfK/SrfK
MPSLRCLLFLSALLLNGCALTDFSGPRPTGRASIVIDLTAQRAYLYRGKTLMIESPASTGREGYDTPTGKFHVIQKDLDHRSTIYGEYVRDGSVVVPGIDNRKTPRPPGTVFEGAPMPYFLRIVGAVGMHAGEVPHYPASHGCIRLPPRKARRFFAEAKVGTPVTIRR